MSECSGYLLGTTHCWHGFPQNAACSMPVAKIKPWCCNETLCARLWPETGKPSIELVEKIRRDATNGN